MATRADVRRIALALRGAKEVTVAELRVLLEEGWRCQAPKELLQAGNAAGPARTAKAKKKAKKAGKKHPAPMRPSSRRSLALGFATACGLGSAVSAECQSSPARPTAAHLPALHVDVRDGSISAPDTARRGWTRVHVTKGGQGHILVVFRLRDGVRASEIADFVAALDTARSTPSVAVALSGPEVVDPGDVVVNLTPGRYVLACMHRDANGHRHVHRGETKALVVGRRLNGSVVTLPPRATADIHMADFAYRSADRWRAGAHWVRVTNEGREDHLVLVARLADGVTLRDWMSATDQDRIAEPLSGAARMGPGVVTYLPMTLSAGRYVLYCLIPHAATGKSHVELGMFKGITVE